MGKAERIETTTLALDSIVIGERVRKDMGDVSSLADSITRHGLLHPVVVKSDNTLVAGHRRLEAVRLLGWTDIPVTVIDVADLLSAERDENAERKDFTPTEAVAIGRLIEAQHKIKIDEQEAYRKSMGSISVNNLGREKVGPKRTVAANAVGLSETAYHKARAVVAAAEANPEKFGDLPEQMDETGKIEHTYQEMRERSGTPPQPRPTSERPAPKPSRHQVHRMMHYPKRNQEMQRAITALDGICICLEAIPTEELDAARTAEWAESLKRSASIINRVARSVVNVKA